MNDEILKNVVTPSNKRKNHPGRQLKSPAAEQFVMSRATEFRDLSLPVTGYNMALQLKSELDDLLMYFL